MPKFGNFRTNIPSSWLNVEIRVSCLWLVLSSQNLAISEHILYLSFSLGGTKMQTYCHFHKNISPAWLNVQIQSLVSGGTKLPKYGYF